MSLIQSLSFDDLTIFEHHDSPRRRQNGVEGPPNGHLGPAALVQAGFDQPGHHQTHSTLAGGHQQVKAKVLFHGLATVPFCIDEIRTSSKPFFTQKSATRALQVDSARFGDSGLGPTLLETCYKGAIKRVSYAWYTDSVDTCHPSLNY